MLKGLKLKSKLPDKNTTDSSTQPPPPTRIEEEPSVNKEST